MKVRKWILGCATMVWLFSGVPLAAQPAQVVQLPTLGSFSVNTTVTVPDSGAGFLGSHGTGRWGSVSRGGIPPTRGIGGGVTLPMASVNVHIIDLEALDKAILEAAQDREASANLGETSSQSGSDLSPERSLGQRSLGLGASKADQNRLARDRLSSARLAGGITRSTQRGNIDPASSERNADRPLNPIPPKDDPEFSSNRSSMNADRTLGRKSEYGYLATLSHPESTASNAKLSDDVRFYLNRAQTARRGGQWAAAQLFYEQTWKSLGDSKQQKAVMAMNRMEAAAEPAKDSKRTRQAAR